MMRHWLDEATVKLTTSVEGGFKVERPSYWVVRLDVSSFTSDKLRAFVSAVERTACLALVPQIPAIRKYARERFEAKSLDAELRYVNMMGGEMYSEGVYDDYISSAVDWLEAKGYGRHMSIVPGPLIRATLGAVLTHMPLTTKSTYTHLIGAMKAAFAISSKMEEPDIEFDLQGLKEPKFGNHSLRRHSDRVARESLPRHMEYGVSDVTKQVIDYFYGWLLKEMRKDMQLHYAGLDRYQRRVLARVSMFL